MNDIKRPVPTPHARFEPHFGTDLRHSALFLKRKAYIACMVKFGERLLHEQSAELRDKYIEYDALKQLIAKKDAAAFLAKLKAAIDVVNAFYTRRVAELV